jgi:hypothetical protein
MSFLFKFLITLILLSVLGFVSLVFLIADPLELQAPSDKKLKNLFSAHLQDFQKLSEMNVEDSSNWRICAFGPVFGTYKPLSASRKQEYKNLITGIDKNLFIECNDGDVCFHLSNGGVWGGGAWSKGIEYIHPGHGSAESELNSLNWMVGKPPGRYPLSIGSNWYIYFYCDNYDG